MRLIHLKGIRTKIRLVITLPSFPMKRAAMWLTPPRLTLIRIGASTKKTFITFGYSLVDRHPHRPQRQLRHRVPHQRQRRRLRLQLRLLRRLHLHRRLLPLRHQDLLLLQDPFPRPGGDQHRGRDLEFTVISDREHLAAMSEIVSLAPVSLLEEENMEGRAPASLGDQRTFVGRRRAPPSTVKTPFQARYQGSADTSRQLCRSGLVERQRSGSRFENREQLRYFNALAL
jgi:hypothetical protein